MDPPRSARQPVRPEGRPSLGRALMGLIVRRPGTLAALTWAVSLVAGASALVLADFGGPPWVFLALGAWLLTVGLPTLAGTLLVAYLTGVLPSGALPLGPALLAIAIASLVLQSVAFLAASRLLGRRFPKRAA